MKEKLLTLLITTILLSGCNSSSSSETSNNKTTNAIENTASTTGDNVITTSKPTENTTTINTTNNTIAYQPAQSTGRLLASNCFQCHATNGAAGFERIAGGEASDIYKYTTKIANSSIMAAHAQGYTSTQLTSLIGYLNQL
jgi:sulfide dehydrogenase cytochrome subunit